MLNFEFGDDLDDVQEASEMLLEQSTSDTKGFIPAILVSTAILALAKEIRQTTERSYNKGEHISNTDEALMRIHESISQLATAVKNR